MSNFPKTYFLEDEDTFADLVAEDGLEALYHHTKEKSGMMFHLYYITTDDMEMEYIGSYQNPLSEQDAMKALQDNSAFSL